MEEKMKKTFNSIKRGLQEAIAHASGSRRSRVHVHRPNKINVKSIRNKIGMTQMEFASSFGISVATLRHWERGDRLPNGPARVLLNVVERSPETVLKVANG
jgi:putative transcriptional regulator